MNQRKQQNPHKKPDKVAASPSRGVKQKLLCKKVTDLLKKTAKVNLSLNEWTKTNRRSSLAQQLLLVCSCSVLFWKWFRASSSAFNSAWCHYEICVVVVFGDFENFVNFLCKIIKKQFCKNKKLKKREKREFLSRSCIEIVLFSCFADVERRSFLFCACFFIHSTPAVLLLLKQSAAHKKCTENKQSISV